MAGTESLIDQRIYAPDSIPLPRREDCECEVMTVYELG